jgi:hypothetical protein
MGTFQHQFFLRDERQYIGCGMLCVCLMLWLGASPVRAAVVTDYVISQSSSKQANVPVTFGQVFRDGDVPLGATLSATIDGHHITLQVDPKASNPDGSLRHAVLTAVLPSLEGRANLPFVLSSQTSTATGATPITLAQLLATGYDAEISLTSNGKHYTLSARKLLQTASAARSCQPWGKTCNVWLSGPLAAEWVVNGPVATADGANLRVYFAVRAYAGSEGGTVCPIRTDIIGENSDAFAPQAHPQYTATLASGSASYTSPALTQYTATRWHKVLWWNNDEPQVYLQQDTRYIQASKAISRYMELKPDDKFLASLRQDCAPLDHCDQTKSMSNVGAQPAIGPLPRWTSLYIVDPDMRAYWWMLANADALGAYSVHYRDPETGWPVSIKKHPYVTVADWAYATRVARQGGGKAASYRADLLPGCIDNEVVEKCKSPWYRTGNPYLWDNAHQPSWAYVPYMVTGSWYYMSELAFGASYNNVWSNESYRGFSKGLIDRSHDSMRGKAWTLRNLAEAAFLLPDDYPLKGEFISVVRNSLDDWNRKYSNNPDANPLHVTKDSTVYGLHGGEHNGVAPWQHNFLTWSVGHVADLGFADAIPLRNWLARFEIGLMIDWQNDPAKGYCWLQASAYKIQVKDAAGNWLPSYSAVYAATFPALVGLACNSMPMLTALHQVRKKPVRAGEMSGYPYAATGFPANFQIGIAAAADSGLPKAHQAWQLFESRSIKPTPPHSYDDYPNFAVLPRSVPH